ncbi:unnamed protein product, partial [Meganyctiphanes norvegica]
WEDIPGPSWAGAPGESWEYGHDQSWRQSVLDEDFTNLTPADPYASESVPNQYAYPDPITPPPTRKLRGRQLSKSTSSEPAMPIPAPPTKCIPVSRGRRKPTRAPQAQTSTRKRGRQPISARVISSKAKRKTKPLDKKVKELLMKKWKWLDIKPLDLYMQQFDFDGPLPGPTQHYNRPICPLEVFESFQTSDIVDFIVEESNTFGRKKRSESKGRVKNEDWIDITSDDIRLMDAILITMGIVNMPHIDQYWAKDPIFDYGFIRNIMS